VNKLKTLKGSITMKNLNKKAVVTYTLNDTELKAVNSMVGLIGQAEKLSATRNEVIVQTSEMFAKTVGTNPTFEQWTELVNQLTMLSIKQLGIAESTFKNYLTDIYKNCEIMFDLVKPKKQSSSAVSMAKARAELADKNIHDLKTELAVSAKNLDFTQAKKIQSEIARREKADQSELARTEGKAVTELKNSLKKWIGKLQPNELACLVYVRENFEEVLKLANKKN
jgi:excinuclease UvrABC helicase subunit UvrB